MVSHRSSFNVTIGSSFGENDSKHVKFQHVCGLHKCTLPTFIVAFWLQRHKNHNVITNKIRKLRLTALCYRLYWHLKWTRTLFACISNDAKHLVKIYAARASEVLRQRCIKITSCFNGRLLLQWASWTGAMTAGLTDGLKYYQIHYLLDCKEFSSRMRKDFRESNTTFYISAVVHVTNGSIQCVPAQIWLVNAATCCTTLRRFAAH